MHLWFARATIHAAMRFPCYFPATNCVVCYSSSLNLKSLAFLAFEGTLTVPFQTMRLSKVILHVILATFTTTAHTPIFHLRMFIESL
jgi:hypothetical protein